MNPWFTNRKCNILTPKEKKTGQLNSRNIPDVGSFKNEI